MRRFGLVLLSGALALIIPAAQGHSTLVTSTPKSGAVVKTFPKNFSLTFNEEILRLPGKEPSRVQLIAPNAKRISLGKVAIAKEVLTVPMSKAAVKAGTALTLTEIDKLLDDMTAANLFSHCPHGRPVVKRFTSNDIKRWFYRS